MFNSSEPPTREASPEDLIHATKAITMTTTRAISAGNSVKQSEVCQVVDTVTLWHLGVMLEECYKTIFSCVKS